MGEAAVIKFSSPEDEERYHRSRARRGRGEGRDVASDAPTRVLPHSLEAEEFLLSCCALDGSATIAAAYAKGVRTHKFYEAKHGTVWGAFEKLWTEQRSVDVSVVAEFLKDSGELERIGGWAFLGQCTGKVPTTARAAEWIERVMELAERREIIRAAQEAAERAYQLDEDAGLVSALDTLQGLRTRSQRDLPAIMSDAELEAKALPAPPMLVDQVMHQGRRTLLLAPSKASKTWTAMSLSMAIASGLPWLGFRTHKAPVLHIDLELPDWGLKERRTKLRELMGVKGALDVDWWSLDGYQRSIDELLPLITARAPKGKFGLITIEPAYVILGRRDENDNADVTDFMNRLAWIARLTGAAVLCTHHFAKGDAGKKDVKDRGSGAGAWVRAPDTAIALTPLDESQGDDCYSMEFIERNMKRHAPVGVQFEYPLFRLRSGLDLSAVREAGRPREHTVKDILAVLEKAMEKAPDGLTFSRWKEKAEAREIKESTFKRLLKEAVANGRVAQMGPLYVLNAEGSK